jgi:methionyl-tRNA formyltransferase
VTTVRPTCAVLGSDDGVLGLAAVGFARAVFDLRHARLYPDPCSEDVSDELRVRATNGEIDLLFSVLSPVIVPAEVLGAVRLAVNFHPAPPEWPGVGGASYALYEGRDSFGATAHVMEPQVDAGTILDVRRFAIRPGTSSSDLLTEARHIAYAQFIDIATALADGREVRPSGHWWARRAFTRREFEAWMTVSPNDQPEDIDRKVRAVSHPTLPGPHVELGGHRFTYAPRDDDSADR